MNRLSFLGETPTEALRNAQIECGEDAIVISTKKIANANGYNKDMYEIVVAVEDEEIQKNMEFTKTAITKATVESQPIKAQVYDYKEEILKMQSLLEQVQKTLWKPKSQLYDLLIPPEFIDVYTIFEKNEFDSEMTYTIMKKTIKELPVSLKSNQKKVNDFFKLVLRRVIPIKMEQNHKVGVITLDSFRVGAIEQLQAYTNIMRLPLEIVKKPEDLTEALLRLKNCNYIFIDTAGSSQYDIDKIELINEYRNHVYELPSEKTLVLPSNVKHSDLMEIYKNYSILDIDNLIFTKLDETKSFGNVISFSHKTKKSITYFSIGQNVPDDLIAADASFLIDCFMNNECSKEI